LKIFFHPFPQYKTFWGRNVNQLITVKDYTLQGCYICVTPSSAEKITCLFCQVYETSLHVQGPGLEGLERVWKSALSAAGVTEDGKGREC